MSGKYKCNKNRVLGQKYYAVFKLLVIKQKNQIYQNDTLAFRKLSVFNNW